MEESYTDQNELAKAMEELAAGDANPFWKKFLQPDQHYGVGLDKPLAPVIEQALNTEQGKDQPTAFNQITLYEESKGEKSKDAKEDALERKKMKELAKIR